MRDRYGATKNWPDVLKLGRIIRIMRNAFAHGGVVNIADRISGNWNGIQYSPLDSGRRVLYNDMSAADLTLLMIEMDAQV